MAHTTITFHGVEVTLPAGVSFSSDGTTLTLDLSAGFAGVLRLRGVGAGAAHGPTGVGMAAPSVIQDTLAGGSQAAAHGAALPYWFNASPRATQDGASADAAAPGVGGAPDAAPQRCAAPERRCLLQPLDAAAADACGAAPPAASVDTAAEDARPASAPADGNGPQGCEAGGAGIEPGVAPAPAPEGAAAKPDELDASARGPALAVASAPDAERAPAVDEAAADAGAACTAAAAADQNRESNAPLVLPLSPLAAAAAAATPSAAEPAVATAPAQAAATGAAAPATGPAPSTGPKALPPGATTPGSAATPAAIASEGAKDRTPRGGPASSRSAGKENAGKASAGKASGGKASAGGGSATDKRKSGGRTG